jgi:hypothetical protein
MRPSSRNNGKARRKSVLAGSGSRFCSTRIQVKGEVSETLPVDPAVILRLDHSRHLP